MKWVLSLVLAVWGLPVIAACAGHDVRPSLDAGTRSEIAARVAGMPFAEGNHWRATKGDTVLHLIGTLHIDDARMGDVTERLRGVVETSDLALFEMTPKERAELERAMGTDPNLLFMQDTTLPELLQEPDWQAVSTALRARNIPPILASRFQPWYVSVLLAMPPCLSQTLDAQSAGLDHRLIDVAQEAGVPIKALEPWDTMFGLFADEPLADQLNNVLIGLDAAQDGEDALATLRAAYFEERHGEAWEVSRWYALKSERLPRDEIRGLFEDMQADLLDNRNAAWMPVILEAAETHDRIALAFGAAHLSGARGVLALLQAEGFDLERLPF